MAERKQQARLIQPALQTGGESEALGLPGRSATYVARPTCAANGNGVRALTWLLVTDARIMAALVRARHSVFKRAICPAQNVNIYRTFRHNPNFTPLRILSALHARIRTIFVFPKYSFLFQTYATKAEKRKGIDRKVGPKIDSSAESLAAKGFVN